MKHKFNLLIITLLICITTIFAGCTKADKATYIDIQSKFNTELSPYTTTKKQTGSAILCYDGINYDYVFQPEQGELKNKIGSNDSGEYSMLNENSIYATIINTSSQYFLKKFMNNSYINAYKDRFSNVPQNQMTNLWYSTDDVINQIKIFGERYRRLVSCYDYKAPQASNALNALDKLLKQYKTLIGSVLQQDLDAQDIFDNYIFVKPEVTDSVPLTEIFRIRDAFTLYITEYFYQRYMVFDTKTQLTIDSDNELFKTLKVIANSEISGDSTQVDTYKYLLLAEKSMRNKIELNRNAVKILNGKVPAESDKDYDYKNLVYQDFVSFEQTLIGYANDLLSIIKG